MNLHEYQAKEVFSAYGIPVPTGRVAATPDEAVAAAEALGGQVWVVKAQVHAGGRGKAGGVKLARDTNAVREAAKAMLGTRLATKQTGPEGLPVDRVYVETGSAIDREIYLSLTLNREKGFIAMVGSAAGGMDIEEVAEHSPEKITTVNIHPAAGLQPYQCRRMAFALGFKDAQIAQFQKIAMALYQLYLDKDASLLEVNPLIVTKTGELVALDAKINIDANATYRQKALAAMRDTAQEDPMEHRVHGQRRRARDGYDGSHQVARRFAGELPRRGWRRDRRARHGGLQAHPLEPEGEGDPRQYLWWNRALRSHC
jgi:succinyl-CoA synthetase beta subunit